MLLPKIFARDELQGPLIISSGSQAKRGRPLIRACSVIRSITVYPFPYESAHVCQIWCQSAQTVW